MKRYDLVVFGATGFTGQFVVEELASTVDKEEPLTWAIAGRNVSSLQAVLEKTQRHTGKYLGHVSTLAADITCQLSLKQMCQETKVIINCVGPYTTYGLPVIEACIENGCHHIDMCGETNFLKMIHLKYQKEALEKGVYLIAGGCIPLEMLIIYTKRHFQGVLRSVQAYERIHFSHGMRRISYGTWLSRLEGATSMAIDRDLSSGERNQLPVDQWHCPKKPAIFYNHQVQSYCMPFPGVANFLVAWTQRCMYETFQDVPVFFRAYMRMPSLVSAVKALFMNYVFLLLSKFGTGKFLLRRFPEFFSGGMFSRTTPNRTQILGTSYTLTLFGEGHITKPNSASQNLSVGDLPRQKITTKLEGPDPGYISIPACLVQAAYVLLSAHQKLPVQGGVLTPGFAFCNTNLVDRLSKRHHHFTVIEQ